MDDGSAIGLIIALAVLLLFSAYFSASETAFTGFNQVRMKKLAEKKSSARLVLKLSENYNNILSTLLIGNNIVNIAAASLATIVFTHYFGDLGVTLSTVVMTILVLIFGEISPKSLAKERPERFAMLSARPLYFFTILFWPLNFVFNVWKKFLVRVFKLNRTQPTLTEEEFQLMVTEIKDEGVLNEIEHEIIQNTIRYDEILVEKVMTPLDRFASVDDEMTCDEIKTLFESTNFSRMPYMSVAGDRVKGILYRADFYEMLLAGKNDIEAILKKPFYTRNTVKISILFKQLQRSKIHMAIVRNGAGDLLGLITMEDILEELLGDIDDRYDAEQIPESDEQTAPNSVN